MSKTRTYAVGFEGSVVTIPEKFMNYNGWRLEYESQAHSLSFVKGVRSVYCTPDFDERGVIAIVVQDFLVGTEILEAADVPYGETFDPVIWFAAAKPFLDKYGGRI